MKRSFSVVLLCLFVCGALFSAFAADQSAVSRVMPRLLAAAKLGRPVSVGVAQDPQINAYADPEKWEIVFFSGLLEKLSSDDHVAYVGAHELAHLKLGHSGERVMRAPLRKPLIPIIGLVSGAFISDFKGAVVGGLVGSELTMNQYSRGQERQADELGTRLMWLAGYDPLAGVAVQEILEKYSGSMPYWLSSHPSNKEREGNIRKYAATLPVTRPAPIAPVRKRTILVLFADYLQDPSVMQTFLLAMGDSEKITILASGPQADAIRQIQDQYGIRSDVTKPDEVYFLSSGAEARYKSGGTSVSTGFGGVAFYRTSDKLVADIAATRYNLQTSQLLGKPLYGKGEARIYSGSSTSIWLPQGSVNWDNQRARSYPQGEALHQAALELRKQFEALPQQVEPAVAVAASSRKPTDWFGVKPGAVISPGKCRVVDHESGQKIGEIVVTEVCESRLSSTGIIAKYYIEWGVGNGPNRDIYPQP